MFRFRSVIIILAGVLGFVLGALYLSVEQMDVEDVVVATGPATVAPGEPAALRVAASDRRGHAARTVQLESAHWSAPGAPEQPLAAELDGTQPGVVRFRPPESADGAATVRLTFRVAGGDVLRELRVPLQVAPAMTVEPAAPPPAPPAGEGGLRVSLLPEVRVLSYRFDGTLFVRVMDAEGAPVAAAVTLRIGKEETRTASAGELGLATVPIHADRPRYQLHARATAEGGRSGEVEEDLRPVPRGQRLRLLPRVVAPGGRYRVEIQAHDPEGTLHCDVLDEGRIRESFTLRVTRGAAATEREAPRTVGRYAVQCAPFWRSPGEAFTTAALVVSAEHDEVAALAAAVRPEDQADARWLADVGARAATLAEEPRRRAADYLTARLTPDYTPSAHLASTLEGDLAALNAERDGIRGKLLLALGVAFAALLTWALVLVASNVRDVRRRSAEMAAVLSEVDDAAPHAPAPAVAAGGPAAAAELDEDELPTGPPPASFGRARSLVQYAVVAVLLVVDVIAVLWLLGTIIR